MELLDMCSESQGAEIEGQGLAREQSLKYSDWIEGMKPQENLLGKRAQSRLGES